MRLDINLASQPYEDARQFWLRWGTGLGAAAVFTLLLITLTASGWYAARRDHATISNLRAAIAERDATRRRAEETLNLPDNRLMRVQSQFLNDLIERKSFSWTRVLEDLEKVMPAGVHLVSIHPELDPDNQLTLKMTVAGSSRDRTIELTRRMEESRHFTQTQVVSEQQQTSSTGDVVRMEMTAIYIPSTVTVPPAAPAPAAAQNRSKS